MSPRNKWIDIGDTVAVSLLPDATRYEVIGHAPLGYQVRQPRSPGMTVDYAAQYIDRSQVVRHWPKPSKGATHD